MNKKAQLQIQETVFVVFIFLIILILGMIFFFQFESQNIKNIRKENDEDAFFFMISYIPSMTELRCSKLGISDECIDLTKAKAFAFMNDNYYREIFGNKKIILNSLNEEVELYNYNPNNHKGERKITSPVSVYDPITEKYLIGVLEVYMYEE